MAPKFSKAWTQKLCYVIALSVFQVCAITQSLAQNESVTEAEASRRHWEEIQTACRQLCEAGDRAYENQNYEKAIAFFDKCSQLAPSEIYTERKAQSLVKLERLPEAIDVLKTISDNRSSSRATTLLVECLIKLRRYEEAMSLCADKYQISWVRDGLNYLLTSKVLVAQQDPAAAKRCLQEGITHCIRYKEPKQDLVDALEDLGGKPSYTVPKITSGNEKTIAAIDALAALDGPINERELHSVFNRMFLPAGSEARMPCVRFWDSSEKFEQVSYDRSPGNNEITVRCNLDQTYITTNDLKGIGAIKETLPVGVKQPENRLLDVSRTKEKYIACKSGYLTIRFAFRDPDQVALIERHFNTQKTAKTQATRLSYDERITEIETLLAAQHYEQARDVLVHHWHDALSDSTPTVQQRRLRQQQDLLLKAMQNKPDIQAYIKAASLNYLTQDVDCKNRFQNELPTLSEFSKHRWHVASSLTKPAPYQQMHYVIWLETYPAVLALPNSELFHQLQARFGAKELTDQMLAEFGPINPELIDDADLKTTFSPI